MQKNIEAKVIFPLVRYLALSLICLLVIAIVAFSVQLILPVQNKGVQYDTIKKAVSTGVKIGNGADAQIRPELPDNLKKYFTDQKNAQVLDGWLAPLTIEQKNDFLRNMSVIVEQAEKNNDNIADIINTYKTEKLKNFNASEIEQMAEKAKPIVYGTIISIFLITIILLSIVLILLAIEKNTNRDSEVEFKPALRNENQTL